MATLSGISCPFFKTAFSKTIPGADSASPFARALAAVTCPITLVPLGITTLPSDLVADVVFAVTGSPGLFFLASTGCESEAFIAVPFARLAELCPAFAEAEAELLFEPCAPDLSACTDVLLLAAELAWD